MITHLEPDILEFEVKWALESIMISKEGLSKLFLIYVRKNVPLSQVYNVVVLMATFCFCRKWSPGERSCGRKRKRVGKMLQRLE